MHGYRTIEFALVRYLKAGASILRVSKGGMYRRRLSVYKRQDVQVLYAKSWQRGRETNLIFAPFPDTNGFSYPIFERARARAYETFPRE